MSRRLRSVIVHVSFGVGLLVAIGLLGYAFWFINDRPRVEPEFGVTYSWVYAQQLGLDPVASYEEILRDMGVRQVRLPLYWSSIEAERNVFDWTIPDALVALSEQYGVELTVVVGEKVPRWPECFPPDWVDGLSVSAYENAVLSVIAQEIDRYKTSEAIVRWQVENEPFFPFGECELITVEAFKQRVELVRSLDSRPIQVTVSGEIGPWLESAQAADVLGMSMYRQTYNDLFGYFVYPISPAYYYARTKTVGGYVDQVIVSELQAEPWFSEPIESRELTDWYGHFTVEMFEQNIAFARDAGIGEVSLWGVEWWMAMRDAGDGRLWEEAGELFNGSR